MAAKKAKKAAKKPAKRAKNPPITKEQIEGMLELIRHGNFPSIAALKIGMTKSALSMRRKRDPEFDALIIAAESHAECKLVQDIFDDKDWRAKFGLLERRWRERWGKEESSGAGVDAEVVVKGIAALIQIAEDKHNPPGAPDVDAA